MTALQVDVVTTPEPVIPKVLGPAKDTLLAFA